MSKLANISGKEAIRAFEKIGWKALGQVGSHVVLVNRVFEPTSRFLSIKSFRLERCEL
jgi:predicted RNA binding protein YcfA (HicA-like mRNA interferase family)